MSRLKSLLNALRHVAVVGAVLLAGIAPNTRMATAAEPDLLTKKASAIEYRRVYVPAEKMDAWPRDGEKLIPVESRDFENWIRAANVKANGSGSRAVITSAEYFGTLEANGRLRGEGKWTIALHADNRAFLPIENMAAVIRDAHWQDAESRPARIGMWGKNRSEPKQFGLEVDRGGIVAFQWQIQTRTVDNQIEIPWQLPSANSVRLTLDLPDGMQPRVVGGVVLDSTQQLSDGKSGKPNRRWTIALSPSSTTRLLLSTTERSRADDSDKIRLREHVNYVIRSRGLDMTTIWQLDGDTSQKKELSVSVPPGLQLSELKFGDRELSWRLVRDASLPTDTVIIDLPKMEAEKTAEITFSAWQPLVLDSAWRLPRIRSESLFWSAANFDISASADFEIERLEPTDCINTAATLPTDSDDQEKHSLTAFAPSAAIDLKLARRRADAVVRSGSTLSLVDPDLNGRLVTQWSLSHGAQHQLTGKLSAGWIIEAVETVPADAMTDWFINGRGADRQLEIQLSRSAGAHRNPSVTVTGRLQRFSLAEPISLDTMRIVTWSNARTDRHLLTFQSNEPYVAEPVGQLPEAPQDSLSDAERDVLDQSTDGNVFDITAPPRGAGLQLTLRRGKYSARIDLEIARESESVRYAYRVTAQPASSPIDRLLVHSTAPLGDDVRWADTSSNAALMAEKIAVDGPNSSSGTSEGEAWLLRLGQPTSKPIEITATVRTKRPDRAAVPLLFLPEASRQSGRVFVRSRAGSGIWLEPVRLQAVQLPPARLPEAVDPAPLRAEYRYEPGDCRDPMIAPKLVASASPATQSELLSIRHVLLESFYWPNGNGVHCATYECDSHSSVELKLPHPAEARLVSALLDGRPVDVSSAAAAQKFSASLPRQERPAIVSLYFETHGPALSAGRELKPPLTFDDVAFREGEWTVWLPDEFSAAGTGIWSVAPKFNWRQRLFGVLGRPNGSRPFNPFRLADGAALVNDLAGGQVVVATSEPAEKQSPPIGSSNASVSPSLASTTVSPPAGWQQFRQSFVANAPSPLIVLHPPAVTAWGIAALLTSLLFGRWLRRFPGEAFAIALAILAAIALLMSVAYSTIAAGAIVGLLISLIAEWPIRATSDDDSTFRRRASAAVAVGVAILFAVGIATLSFAQPVNIENRPPEPKLFRVLIPVGENGQPVGTKCYLSDRFLRAVVAAANPDEDSNNWLLNDASFSGELVEKPGEKDIVAGNFTATFSIETRARDTSIVLPMVRDQATWSDYAMLDGVPLPIRWLDGGRTCSVAIAEPGRYSLTFSGVPKTNGADGRNEFDVSVPPASNAKFEVRYPDAAVRPTVLNATVLASTTTVSNVLAGELQSSPTFRVLWTPLQKQETGAAGLVATELRWLTITPRETELVTKFVLQGGNRPSAISIGYDNRWKLLTNVLATNSDRDREVKTDRRLLRVPILSESAERQEIVLRWRLTEPTNLGILRLPPIELTSVPITKRWLAVTADPSLDCEILNTDATEGTAGEFIEMWGGSGSETDPKSVLTNFNPRDSLNLAVRPYETVPMVDESLNLAVGLKDLRVNYEARVTPGIRGAFRLDLSVPAELSIASIHADDSEQQIPLRFSRSADNRVTVFFGQHLVNLFRVELNGVLPIGSNGQASFPHIATPATEGATQRVRVYRDDNVRVEIKNANASNEVKGDPTDSAPPEWKPRPVGTFYLDSDSAAAARMVVTPGKAQVSGETLTELTREAGAWAVNYRCRLMVEDGELDTLRVKIPSTCVGPFEVQSANSVTTEFLTNDDNSGIFTIRLSNTVPKGSSVDVRVRTQLKSSVGAAVAVPIIALEGPTKLRRFVSVPANVDAHAVTWIETGVRRAAVPQRLLAGVAGINPALTFEVASDRYQVATRSASTPENAPQIRVADVSIVAGDRGSQRITTRLVLAMHGLSDCILQLPAGQKLISVDLDDHPTLTRRVNDSQWQLAIGSPRLPQSLVIVSQLAADDVDPNRLALQRPTLLANGQPIPAEVSLWSFGHPQKMARRIIEDADETSAAEQAALRLDRLVSIAEAAKSSAAELPSPDGFNWYLSWARLLNSARIQTQQLPAAAPFERVESQVSRTSDEQIAGATGRLEKWLEDGRKIFTDANSYQRPTPLEAATSTSVTQSAAPEAAVWTYYVAEGGSDSLNLQIQLMDFSPGQVRLIGLPLIAAALIGGIWLMRWPAATDFFCRWPHAVGILIGIAYWAWMWPSWVGILIAAVSVWLALRFDWPGRSIRRESSTVLRGSRSDSGVA
jgi:hypothetical protein